MILATLSATGRVDGDGYPRLEAVGTVMPAGNELQATGTVVADQVGALAARVGQQIVAPWVLSVGGNVIPSYLIARSVRVAEALDGVTEWSVELVREGGKREPLGSPTSWLGVPGGQRDWKITAEMLALTGSRRTFTLLDDGVADNSTGGPSTRVFRGGGAHGRYDRKLVTYSAEPGHGVRSGVIAQRLLDQAGVAHQGVGGGRRLYKEISLVDVPVLDAVNAVLEPELRRVIVDARTGLAKVVDYGAASARSVQATITDSDVLDALGSLSDGQSSDAPSRVIMTGTAQVLREECGQRTEVQVIDSYSIFAPRVAVGRQLSDGTTSTANLRTALAPELRLEQRIILLKTFDCDTVVQERELVLRWCVPETWRYRLDQDGLVDAYNAAAYYYESATQGDAVSAYAWPQERWGAVFDTLTVPTYDSRGYKIASTITRMGYHQTRRPLKDRTGFSAGSTWEEIPYNSPLYVLATGQAVDDGNLDGDPTSRWYGTLGEYPPPVRDREILQVQGLGYEPVGIETVAWQVDESGFIVRETVEVQERVARAGAGAYLYSSGESPDDEPTLRVVEEIDTQYLPEGENAHRRVTSRRDVDGNLVSVEDAEVDGYLPAAELRADLIPSDDPDGQPSAASRSEQQALKVEVVAGSLIPVVGDWTEKVSGPEFAETVEDLERLARWIMKERSSITVSVPLPFSPVLRPGMRALLHLEAIRWDYDLVLTQVEHQQSEVATWTQLTGEHYVL